MSKFLFYASVNLHLHRDGRVLLSRRKNSGWKDGQYGLVAGHVDGNETMAQAMVREAREEAGIELAASDLIVVHTQHRINPDREYIDFHLVTTKWKGEPMNLEPNKCDDLAWFPLENLPATTIPYIARVFNDVAKGIHFSEWRE